MSTEHPSTTIQPLEERAHYEVLQLMFASLEFSTCLLRLALGLTYLGEAAWSCELPLGHVGTQGNQKRPPSWLDSILYL